MQNNPYIGPRPFERADRINFFGRTREARDLLSLIMAERVVLFYAQSGAGKTSLLNTQIIPALEDEGFYVLPVVRVGSDAPPDVPPAMVKNIFVFSVWMGLVGKETQLTTLTGTDLEDALNAWLSDSPLDDMGELRPPLLIIDQFEEILTTHRDRWQDAHGFFEQLARMLEHNPKLGVVLAMREDHVAGLDPYATLLPRRLKARFRMEQLKADGALEAVKKPAQNAGHPFDSGVAEKLVDDLRRVRMLSGQDEQPPEAAVLGPYIEPVQLQVVCRRLWENLPERTIGTPITAHDVEQFGNVDRALTDFYESALGQVLVQAKPLGEEQGWKVREGQLRRWFGKQLITPAQTRGLVMRGADDTGGLPNPVVDLLEARHLIRADVRAGARWYEISHDRLVEPIVRSNAEWEQTEQSPLHRAAQRWLDEGKQPDLLYRGHLLQTTLEYAETHRDECEPIDLEFLAASQKAQATVEREKRQNLIIRRLAIGAVITMVLASVAGIIAFAQFGEANTQKWKAQSEAERANTEASRANSEAQRANAQAELAQKKSEEADKARVAAEGSEAKAVTASLRAQIRQLLAQANEFRETQIPRSILLALEAYYAAGDTHDVDLQHEAVDSVRRIVIGAGGVPLLGHQTAVNTVVWSRNGTRLLTTDRGGGILVHAAPLSLTPTLQLIGPLSATLASNLSLDGRWAAVASADQAVRLWRLSSELSKTGTTTDITATFSLTEQNTLVRALAFSFDGRYLIGGGQNGEMSLWNVTQADNAPPRRVLSDSLPSAVQAIAVSRDWLAAIADDGTSQVWRWGDLNAPPIVLYGTDRGQAIALDPTGRWLATGLADATARLYDLTSPNPDESAQVLSGHEEAVTSVVFSPNGRWLVTGSTDTTARVWDVSQPQPPATAKFVLRGHNDQVLSLDISPDNRWLVTGSRDNTARLWDLDSPDPTTATGNYALRSHEDDVNVTRFSPAGDLLATGSNDTTIRLWPVYRSFEGFPSILRGHTSAVYDLATTINDRWLASGSSDGTVRLWDMFDLQVGRGPVIVNQHDSAVYPVAISADDRWLASGGQDAKIQVTDLNTYSPMSRTFASPVTLEGHASVIRALAFSPDKRWLASGGRDATVRLWDFSAGQPPTTSLPLRGHTDQIRVLGISPDSHWLVSGGDDRLPRLWDLTGVDPAAVEITQSIKLSAHQGDVQAVAFSPDQQWLVTGGSGNDLFLWDLRQIVSDTPEITTTIVLPGHTRTVRDVEFSHDGKLLASAAADNTIRLWQWLDGSTVPTTTAVLRGHTGEVRSIAISDDGQWLVSGSEDGTARVWNLTAADPAANPIVLVGHVGPVWKVLINDDGSIVETAGQDAQVHHWRPQEIADSGKLDVVACYTAGRSLRPDEWAQYIGGDYRATCQSAFPEIAVAVTETPTDTVTGAAAPTTPVPTDAGVAALPTPIPTRVSTGSTRPPVTPTPRPAVSAPLALNYTIESAGQDPSNPALWSANVLLTASGGDGRYTYYHDGLPLDSARVTVVYAACRNKPGSFWVVDGTGARVSLDYFMYAPYCNKK
jgi:WD40 repeat protein